MKEYKMIPLKENVDEMFIGPFGSSLKNDSFVDKENAYCIVYEQKHAIQKTMNIETRYVDRKKYEELSRFNIKGGDIIVSCRGTIGETFIVPNDAPVGIMHPSIMKIRLKDGVYNTKYFNALLISRLKKHESEANGSGIKMAISAKALGEELFPVPLLEEQVIIANIIDKLHKILHDRKTEIKKLDDLIKARFVEMFVGKDYPLISVDDLSLGKGEYGAQSASMEYDARRPRYVRITDINDDGTLNNDFVSSSNIEDDEQYKLSYGDFLFARMGATVGKTYAFQDGNQIYAGYLIRYRLNLDKMIPEYLYAYTKLDEYWNWIKLNQSGAAQPGINAKKYGSLRIPVPPLSEQRAFQAFVSQVDKSKSRKNLNHKKITDWHHNILFLTKYLSRSERCDVS